MYLPTLSGYDIQKRVDALNNDLSVPKGEIADCQSAILQLRAGTDPENARRDFRIFWSLSEYSKDIIDRFKEEMSQPQTGCRVDSA